MSANTPVFMVSESVFSQRPDYVVGCVLAREIDNERANGTTTTLLADAITRAQLTYGSRDLKDVPELAAWRRAFSQQGWSGSRYPSSAEAIIKRVARGKGMPSISPIVDIANASVLFYGVPVGTHDIDLCQNGPLTVRLANEEDRFRPMGADEAEPVPPGEIVYVCGNDVRTRRWVWRQSQSALVQPESRNIFIPVDGFRDLTEISVSAATEFIAETCREAFGSTVTTGLVTKEHNQFNA